MVQPLMDGYRKGSTAIVIPDDEKHHRPSGHGAHVEGGPDDVAAEAGPCLSAGPATSTARNTCGGTGVSRFQ